jgi:hypothetical protein
MASQKFEKGSKEFRWFGEFWKLAQKVWIPGDENDDEYWDGVVRDINDLTAKYAAEDDELKKFSIRTSVALLEFLEMRYNGNDYFVQDESDLRNLIDLWRLAKTDENVKKILSGVSGLIRR